MSDTSKPGTGTTGGKNPRDIDAGATDHVEKSPKPAESPQQQHDNEDHG